MPGGFEDLEIWQESQKYMVLIYEISSKFPKSENFNLIDQIRRSALSVPANIAEAQGRYHYLDKIKFLYNSRGSAEETRSHLFAARDLGYLNNECFNNYNILYIELIKRINHYINYIRKNQ